MRLGFLMILIIVATLAMGCATAQPAPATDRSDLATPQAVPLVGDDAQDSGEVSPKPAVEEDKPAIETLRIEGADGLQQIATFYPGQGDGPRPALLLLHQLGSNRAVWQSFAGDLSGAGYAVMALDMRGHGETGGGRDWQLAQDDLISALSALRDREDVDGDHTAIVGASIGANMALVTGAVEPGVDTVVLLSPGLNFQRVTTDDVMPDFGERPVLIVASKEDSGSASASETLLDLASDDRSRLKMYEGAGHGTAMFGPQPELGNLIIGWLDQTMAGDTPE
ncbi:MAG: alpha/beta fold hydrolase [Chloroflexota bacterium]|nr:alpha/beta fold hydrolase [Chloroflexota bacterium]